MRKGYTLVLFVATLAALILLQNSVLERTGERKRENVRAQLTDLPAKDMVPTYIGSLFLGSFRALAIDIFWIQLKEAQEERRWYQAREIMEMISRLQPYNEEVWSMLAWDSAYNIANSEKQISEDRAWKWIRYGLLKLREGIRLNPRSPYLAFELARILQHKPSWQTGNFDMEFLTRIEQDDEIQEKLQFPERDGTKSAFELSLLWFEETIRRLQVYRESEDLFFRTQMGLYLHEDTMEGFIRESMYLEAIYLWTEARRQGADSPAWQDADRWLDRAENQAKKMAGQFVASSISEELAAFYRELSIVFKASHAFHQNPNGEMLRTYVSALENLMIRSGPIDGGYVLKTLSQIRQDLSGPGGGDFIDRNEFNDTHPFASPLGEGNPLYGNLLPLHDVDSFVIWVPTPGRPVLHLTRIGGTDLEITVGLGNKPALLKKIIRNNNAVKIPFEAHLPGWYHVDIRPIAPNTSDTRYRIEIKGVPADHEH